MEKLSMLSCLQSIFLLGDAKRREIRQVSTELYQDDLGSKFDGVDAAYKLMFLYKVTYYFRL